MKQAKKFLALLAAAALAMTLLAGCTVRPGPDGNVIIVPDDEEEYIPAPPVVTMPEDVGTIVEESEKQLNGYHETTYSKVYVAMQAELQGNRYYGVVKGKFENEPEIEVTLAKYDDNYYVCIKQEQSANEVLIIAGTQYMRIDDNWALLEDQIPLDGIKAMIIPNMSEEGTQWYSAETTNGFNVDRFQKDGLEQRIYCWNNKLARIEKVGSVQGSVTYRTQTTLPDSIENLLKNPPIPPETPAPVN